MPLSREKMRLYQRDRRKKAKDGGASGSWREEIQERLSRLEEEVAALKGGGGNEVEKVQGVAP